MRNPDTRFAGRNWTEVKVKELANPDDLRFVDVNTTVEKATNVCGKVFVYSYTLLRYAADPR
jgi:hypothetical protein